MANEDQLNILLQGAVAWNNWREEIHEGEIPDEVILKTADLSDANLSWASLYNADLRKADLSWASLYNADLWHADLSDADLSYANLSKADLIEANLDGADLSTAHLYGADLNGADLVEAYLDGADLRKADLTYANLRKAKLNHAKLSGAKLRSAVLRWAKLNHAKLSGADLSEAVLIEADLGGANLRSADLHGADLRKADLRGADLNGANLIEAYLDGADLRKADLHGADLRKADLYGVNLRSADLTDADLSAADLSIASLVEATIVRTKLTGCRIYGISAWGLKLDDETKQRDLIITPYRQPTITVDNIEVAQFVYLLLHNKKIRQVIDTITSKVVLILGQFSPERKAVLGAIREELRRRGYVPVLFDFDKPDSRDVTETVTTLARLARFIIADITDPKSIPLELQAIIPDLAVPVQPLLLEGASEFSMFRDLRRKYHWVLQVHIYKDPVDLFSSFDEKVIAPAAAKAIELRDDKK